MINENPKTIFEQDLEHDRARDRAFPPGEAPSYYPKFMDTRTGRMVWERPGDPTSVDADGFGYEAESIDESY